MPAGQGLPPRRWVAGGDRGRLVEAVVGRLVVAVRDRVQGAGLTVRGRGLGGRHSHTTTHGWTPTHRMGPIRGSTARGLWLWHG